MQQRKRLSEDSLSRTERRQLKAQQKEDERRDQRHARLIKKTLTWSGAGLVVAAGLGWLGYSIATTKRLPPTSIVGHTEEVPSGHILTTPMPLAIQKHMLEHADGLKLSDTMAKLYQTREQHDPSNMNRAREIAGTDDLVPIGILYRDENVPRYDQITKPKQKPTWEQREALLNKAFDRFGINTDGSAAAGNI